MKVLQLQKIVWGMVLLTTLLASCSRKSYCPVYWEGSDGGGSGAAVSGGADKTDWKIETNATKPADGGGGNDASMSAGSGDPETTSEFPMVRVKRDKNGIISKKPMQRNKVKRTDPRKKGS
ncbi:hypothetical protein QNI16_23425 [Cytophagaceae bacterium YF14B1]|uniref:Lipoprotein n=1 Tax=Xanthocytophaga flava TaxID=3048013 RepID=A0AAE3QU24_9BACT|nr:hypothetical protein [Xanthocytophaga flavus]MDJ1471207.1 hypothetical protein [Xanthocytophaga flavus]MDJ1483470.1 hypothetical protein [Xanthocytophaga flavus]